MENFEIVSERNFSNRKFSTSKKELVFKIRNPSNDEDALRWIQTGIMQILVHLTMSATPSDKIGFTFSSENFKMKTPGWMSFRETSKVTFDDVWDVLGSIFQSNIEDALDTNTFRVTATIVNMPQGRGRQRIYNNFDEECRGRLGIVQIKNEDNLCLPRAIVVAKAYTKQDPQYQQIRKDTRKIQTEKVENLMKKTGVIIGKNGAGIPELHLFQTHLKKYKISVYKYGTRGRELVFEGPDAPLKINLLYHDGHYNVITSLTSAFSCSYYCQECHVPHNNKERHRCAKSCPACQQNPPCALTTDNINCSECNRKFRGTACFNNHLKMCNTVKRCAGCLKTVNLKNRKQPHVCGEIFCKLCSEYKPRGHFCYIQKDKRKPKLNNQLFVFYDLETKQDKSSPYDSETKIHEPNLCVVQQCCDQCLEDEVSKFCEKCGVRQHVIEQDVICNLLNYILAVRKSYKTVTCIAHNSQGFDAQFILNNILQKTSLKPNLIMRGSKILMMGIGNVKFTDSLSYFPMALADLPKAFGMCSIIKKGYFPHLFNTLENQSYVGALPDLKYYDPDSMKPEAREQFLEWYNETLGSGYVFDMKKDLVEYCISDVNILRRACLQFRQMFLEECDVCPFTEAITIPGACNLMFRRKFLQPNTIGVIPKNGYRLGDNQSKIALQWLIWEEDRRQIHIQHAGRQREAIVQGFKVDGLYDDMKQIFEFHGCFYHGCTSCMTHNRREPLHGDPNDTLELRFERTTDITEKLRNHGYEVIEMWECQFRKMLNKPELKYLHNHPLLNYSPINPRDAFYGGRTGNTKLKYIVNKGEKIKYLDVCSLYPWVCKYGKFPIGHPVVYTGEEAEKLVKDSEITHTSEYLSNMYERELPTSDFENQPREDRHYEKLRKLDGIIKCTLIPPDDLYHPVLPVRMRNTLLFPLCRKCSEEQYPYECMHTPEERAITGTWIIDEVVKALDMGYKIEKIFEIWKYDTVQLNDKTEGLFTKFINKFLKIKQEASGWPSNCTSKEEKDQYIEDYLNREGIQLECQKITKNPGLRSLAKLILNSFWGKFGQQENQQKTSIINNPHELFDMLSNPNIEVHYIQEVNDETVIVNWQYRGEVSDPLPTVNVAIAAYVTTQARLKLYSYLEKLKERVLYYDTDSIIFVSSCISEYEPSTGSFLGDLTDELEEYGVNSYITRFASGGPKVYGYEVFSPTTGQTYVKFKAKGITLNYENSRKVNLDSLMYMIDDPEIHNSILVSSRNIRRTEDHQVITKTESKTFKLNFKKRRLVESFDTIPFGYKRKANMKT